MDNTLLSNCIQLESFLKVKKDDYERKRLAMHREQLECLVWKKFIKSLKREWAAHNSFHALGGRRKTADLALNWSRGWLTRVGYAVVVGRLNNVVFVSFDL